MICLIQLLLYLGLISIALAVLVGELKPREALQKVGAFLLLLLLGPAVLAVLIKGVVFPAAALAWSGIKHLLVFVALLLAVLLIVWVIAGVFQLYRNRNSGEHRVHSAEE